MICERCGNEINDGQRYCAVCGRPVTASTVAASNTSYAPAETPAPVQDTPADNGYRHIGEPEQRREPPRTYTLTADQLDKIRIEEQRRALNIFEAEARNEKQFFGAGALTACLITIGVLSVACGIFAGLYFSLL